MNLVLATSASLAQSYRVVRDRSVELAAPLRPEDAVVQPVTDVSPPKWHLGHTSWFFEQFLLKDFLPGYQVFHPGYAFVFNSYYEGAGPRWQRSQRGNLSRPTLSDILTYRAHVDAAMGTLLAQDHLPERARTLVELGLQHEEQHQELMLYDVKYILGHNPLFPPYHEQPAHFTDSPARPAHWLEMPEGVYETGFQGQGFHFDNEEGRHRVFLEAFRLHDRLTTNGEYLEFMEAGGYRDFRWWLQEGWHWVNQNQVDSPMYWHQIDGVWMHYTLHGLEPVLMGDPVAHVSYYEADAYARWRGLRLATEFEWEAAAARFGGSAREGGNFMENRAHRPLPSLHNQLFGDLWEWTSSAYLPYPFFKTEEGPVGEYNGKFMVNQMVLRGGSCATPQQHIRLTYRNFFHPHLRWLFCGIRLAQHI